MKGKNMYITTENYIFEITNIKINKNWSKQMNSIKEDDVDKNDIENSNCERERK
jgi:hypothetical protein